jgi:hypothetical protein
VSFLDGGYFVCPFNAPLQCPFNACASECQRDFNPPEQCAAQRTLWRSPTPPKRTCPDHGYLTFPDRSARADVLEVSRFSCTLFPGVHGVFDYAEPGGHSRITRLAGVAFPLTEKGRHSGFSFS